MKDFIIAKQGDGVPIISLILVFSLTAVRAFLFDKVKSNWCKLNKNDFKLSYSGKRQ